MIDPQAISTLLQFGFAGVLLAFVWLVNRQFIQLVAVLEKHLTGLMALLELCLNEKKDRTE